MNRRMLRVTFCVSGFVLIVAASVFPQQVRYGTGSWDAATLGNHRAVLRVAVTTDAVWAHIPWRRRDTEPEKKAIIVTNQSGLRIPNVLRIEVNRNPVPLNMSQGFCRILIHDTIRGMVRHLKLADPNGTIRIEMEIETEC